MREERIKQEQIAAGLRSESDPRGVNLAELFAAYKKYIAGVLRPSTIHDYNCILKRMLAELRVNSVADLTPERFRTYMAARREDVCERTVNIDLTVMKRMLTWAVEEKRLAANPLATVKPLRRETTKKKRRALTVQEADGILDIAPEPYRTIWLVAMSTGLRRGELCALQWSDLDLLGGTLTVREGASKNHRPRTVPLRADVRLALAVLQRDSASEYVFVAPCGKPYNRSKAPYADVLLDHFKRHVKAAGIDGEGVDLHALRYTFATHLIRSGVNPKVAQTLLGHADITMTMNIYTQTLEGDNRAAIDSLPTFGLEKRARKRTRAADKVG